MADKLYYVLIGFASAVLVCMVILTYFPLPEGEFACSKCNLSQWYFKVAQ